MKIPASFYIEKGKDMKDGIFHFHNATETDWEKNLEQVRNGYFVENDGKIEFSSIRFEESIKSAREELTRSSKDGEMYMYRYLKPGQTFVFDIQSENKAYLEKIKNILHEKTKYIGKSKNAEFGGAVKISHIGEETNNNNYQNAEVKNTLVYAESNLCFINKYGDCTLEPTAYDLGITGTIDWEKSQVWHHRYMPFNRHRNTWDPERMIIKKGSVFFVTETTAIDYEMIKNGLGVFLTEGFGNVLINPPFLLSTPLLKTPGEEQILEEPTFLNLDIDANGKRLLKYLKEKASRKQQEIDILKKVNEFKSQTFSNISKSQWSKLANGTKEICYDDELELKLFDQENGILIKGAKNPWNNDSRNKLNDFILSNSVGTRIRAVQLLCKEMRNIKQRIS